MKLVKYIGIIFYTTLFALSILILPIKESAAKYVKEQKNALNYGINFKKVSSSGYTWSDPVKDRDYLKYSVSFTRSNYMEERDISESYLINLSDNPSCKIESISSNSLSSYKIENNTINFYEPIKSGEEKVYINISCNIPSMIVYDQTKLTLNTYLYFNDNSSFTYLFASETRDLSKDFDNEYEEGDYCLEGNKICRLLISNDETNISSNYNTLKRWASTATKISEGKEGDIEKYLTSAFPFDLNPLTVTGNIPNIDNLDGIKATISDDGKYYIFEVDDYFGSYASTYSSYNSDSMTLDFYFYENANADALFMKYVEKYLDLSDDQIAYIKNYISSKEAEGENIFDLIKRDSRLGVIKANQGVIGGVSQITYLTVPADLYSVIRGEMVSHKITRSVIPALNIPALIPYLNSYVSPELMNEIVNSSGKYYYFARYAMKTDEIFDNYTYIIYNGEALLFHIYSRNSSEIVFEQQYVDSNSIELVYDINSANTNSNIKLDLDNISRNITPNGDGLILNGSPVDLTNEDLPDGSYTSNIGTINVSTNGTEKVITITFE